MRRLILVSAALLASAGPGRGDPPAVERGTTSFAPNGAEKDIPERYRLEARSFDYVLTKKKDLPLSGVEIYELTFPSPFKSPHPENNTVYAEYYRPKGKGPFPGVIVLDITGGDQTLSRTIARHLAQNQIGGLFVQMAYYGPRRPKGSNLRLMSPDIEHTLRAVRQTVLDLRCAAAWMESRPELDKERLGIMGTSLGSFVAALTCEMEPKLGRCAVLLGGGGFIDAYYDLPQAKPYRKVYEALGGTRKLLEQTIAPIDPITCAHLLKDRKVFIVGAKNDEVVPAKMAENLWKASGEQKILWLDAGHFSAAMYLVPGLNHVVEHFK
jgi:Prolyl oligopeptidase family